MLTTALVMAMVLGVAVVLLVALATRSRRTVGGTGSSGDSSWMYTHQMMNGSSDGDAGCDGGSSSGGGGGCGE